MEKNVDTREVGFWIMGIAIVLGGLILGLQKARGASLVPSQNLLMVWAALVLVYYMGMLAAYPSFLLAREVADARLLPPYAGYTALMAVLAIVATAVAGALWLGFFKFLIAVARKYDAYQAVR